MKKIENIITIAALLLSLTAISALNAPAYNREDEPVSSFGREYEFDDSDEPYIMAEPDEPYVEIIPDTEIVPASSEIPNTGAEDVLGWIWPAAIMMCTGVLIVLPGLAGHKKR